jgi:alpha-L-fucosidase
MMRAALLAAVLALGLAAPASAQEDDYTPDPESLRRHQVPQWFEDAKLGFFIHWGPYAVPAFAPASGGNAYAEWYWNELNRQGSPTWQRHRELYGEDFPYDRFIEQWRAERFDPDAWLRLFVRGGAKYFVQVSKHHDGVALFETATTDRSTVELGPRRDFVRELFDAAERYELKRGLYYSLPEWFHPDNGAFGGTFGQGPPTNPFTGAEIPYTGYRPIDSYVDDHQYPQMLEIIDQYEPDILWCDIGGPNRSNEVMAHYFNQAENPEEVTVNNRCGNGVFDFTTPEYDVEPDITEQKWEATRGIGRSFGYNAEETVEDHLSANELIDSFVDIVSKNGNLLLNFGPRADGTIPELQAQPVRALGEWLDINGEAIYGSTYWTQATDPNANVRVRFTQQPKAFYITALDWPGRRLVIDADVPISGRDEVRLLGARGALDWHRDDDGGLVIETPRRGSSSRDAYTFRIAARGYDPDRTPQLGVSGTAEDGAEGAATEVTVRLANRGDRRIDGGRLTIRAPSGWEAEPAQVRFDRLAPHERLTVPVTVTVPAGTPGGEYALDLVAAVGRHTYRSEVPVNVVGPTTAVDISAAFDNDGISTAANTRDGDFDTSGYTYPAEELPDGGELRFGRVPFLLGSGADGARNNVITNGQALALPAGRYRRAHLLVSASYGPAEATVTVAYADGTTGEHLLPVPDWASGSGDAAIRAGYRHGPNGRDGLSVAIFRAAVDLDPGRTVSSIAVSKATGENEAVAAHVFALTLEE